ncbi:MAG: alpha/beta fold hydrolase [Anaerolineaceae bacterium]|nr:alpha/beta fold hydrolase [Anaerolineaceae bacterium]
MKENKDNQYLMHADLGFDALDFPGGQDGIVLLHGFTASPLEVKPLALALHEHGYTVSAPLLPGHGTHPDDLNKTHYTEWIETAQEAIQALKAKCQRVFIGGESMGGLIALRIAELDLELAGVMIYAPALKAFHLWATPFAKYFVKYLAKSTDDNNLIWSGYGVYPLRAGHEMLKLQRITQKELAKIAQPLLLVTTEKDTMVPQYVSQTIMNTIRSNQKEHLTLKESSHCILIDMEKEAAVHKTLEFLSKI